MKENDCYTKFRGWLQAKLTVPHYTYHPGQQGFFDPTKGRFITTAYERPDMFAFVNGYGCVLEFKVYRNKKKLWTPEWQKAQGESQWNFYQKICGATDVFWIIYKEDVRHQGGMPDIIYHQNSGISIMPEMWIANLQKVRSCIVNS